MENIKKFDIKSFLIGVFLMGWVMLVVVYFMYLRIQEVHQMVPKFIYWNNWIGNLDYSEWFWNDNHNKSIIWFTDLRAFDIKKVRKTYWWYWEVINQVTIDLYVKDWLSPIDNKISRIELEKILKDNIKYNFTIINYDDVSSHWLVDFDTDQVLPWSIEKLFNYAHVNYRKIILPDFYNSNWINNLWDLELEVR